MLGNKSVEDVMKEVKQMCFDCVTKMACESLDKGSLNDLHDPLKELARIRGLKFTWPPKEEEPPYQGPWVQ